MEEIDRGMSTRKASELFNVPRSTLYAKHKGLVPIECSKGPTTYFTAKQEILLVEWIFYCSERGFPITKAMLLQYVQQLINDTKR